MARKQKKSLTKAEEQKIISDFALSLERGRFTEYVEILSNSKRLLWKSFVAGLGRGFGAIIGATLVVALIAGVLAMAGKYLPDPAGDFFQQTGETIQQNPGTN
ncbi:hypothetical protein EXS54_00885 [Patescibacteria group bacterium]|nr:hypothetical protein [Patescibacteria group bacterium]